MPAIIRAQQLGLKLQQQMSSLSEASVRLGMAVSG